MIIGVPREIKDDEYRVAVTPAGWIPGPVYRTVRVGMGLFAFVENFAPRQSSFWKTRPLSNRVPVALVMGCASWEMELDPEMTEEYSSQAGRRAKCRSVHCLSSSFMNVLESVAWFRNSADLSQCLSFVDSKESPITCYSGRHDPHVVKLADFRRLCQQRPTDACTFTRGAPGRGSIPCTATAPCATSGPPSPGSETLTMTTCRTSL